MKKIFLLFLILSFPLLVLESLAQAPGILWQKSYGGTSIDEAHAIRQTTDGGYIFFAETYSEDGDVTGYHDGQDYWLVKIDSIGNIQWQTCFGGTDDEYPESIKQTLDGGYILAGASKSGDGDVTIHYESDVRYDAWIVKTDSAGTIQWERTLGGSNDDYAYDIIQISDSGYVVAGSANSHDGDVSISYGGNDCWVVKLNKNGIIEWEKTYGGSSGEGFKSLALASDGGYVLAGTTNSSDGHITGNVYGNGDIWVVKLDSLGDIEWNKLFGGTYYEDVFSIAAISYGGCILAGYSTSNDGDVSGHHGVVETSYDAWVIKLNNSGNLVWQKSYGGTSNEIAYEVAQSVDGKFIIAGYASSTNGDVTANYGNRDYWVIKADHNGSIEWQKNYGGSGIDIAYSGDVTNDGGFILAGQATIADGDVTVNYGSNDCWIIKSEPINISCSSYFELYPDTIPLYYFGYNMATGSGMLTYSWDWGDGSFDSIAYPSHNYDIAGVYTICLSITDSTGCSDTYCNNYTFKTEAPVAYVNIIDPAITPAGERELPSTDILLYPNPVNSIFTIKTSSKNYIVTIYDITGNVLHEETVTGKTASFNLDKYAQGIYYASIETREKRITKKIVKQ